MCSYLTTQFFGEIFFGKYENLRELKLYQVMLLLN